MNKSHTRRSRSRVRPHFELLEDRAVPTADIVNGAIFQDLNNNGTFDSGETGLIGWRLYSDANGNSHYDTTELFADTDANGNYSFTDLPIGEHTIRAAVRAGWVMTTINERIVQVTDNDQTINLDALGTRQVSIGLMGPETVVNTTQDGIQFIADYESYGRQRSVAADAVGNYVVVWSGNGVGDAEGVFMQRYDANGVAQGGETRVNTTTVGKQGYPKLARASTTGQYAVAWYDMPTTTSSNNNSIKVRLFNTSGTATSGEITVIANSSRSKYGLKSIAMDADGDFAVLYTLESNDTHYVQRFNKLGQPQGTAVKVVTTNDFIGAKSSLSMDANGNFIVVWNQAIMSGQTLVERGAYAQRYDNKGKAVGSKMTLDIGNNYGAPHFPHVAMNASGQFVVTYKIRFDTHDDWYAKTYNANGTLRATVTRTLLNPYAGPSSQSVAIEANGDFILATEHNEIQVHRYTANGVLKEAPFQVNTKITGNQVYPSVAVSGNGTYVVAWNNGQDYEMNDVRVQRIATPAALNAANGEGNNSGTALKQSDLNAIVSAAQKRLKLSRADLAVLRNLNFQITDLPGNMLGQSVGNTIYLDANAAGHGWFIDRTPLSDSEFRLRGNHGEQGKMDLLSAVMHEMSHALGRGHSDHGLMAETLAAGTRSVGTHVADAAITAGLQQKTPYRHLLNR